MNDALRRYYSSPLWVTSRETQTPYQRISAYNETKGKETLATVLQRNRAAGIKKEVLTDDELLASTSSPFSESAPDNSHDEDSSLSSISSRALQMLPLGQTDSAALQNFYFVQGDMLMNLFRFCPECGNPLWKRQLTKVGTAAVVRYRCAYCNTNDQWESQHRTVDHTSERTFRGNVAASAAAIAAGFGYKDIRKWTAQFNLSLFSKSHFWEVFECTRPA
ncbi:hypothetical protein COOONC_13045 [Cooperia oncophora]